MTKKNNLLSIGEMSKLTGVGIRALHYYERKNILKPAYTDPDSGYRYYTFDQAHCVEIISVCLDFNIPLKELTSLFDTEDSARLWDFFTRNKAVAENKLKSISTGLRLMNKALHTMQFHKQYNLQELYTREIAEKTYYIKPCGASLAGVNRIEQIIALTKEGESTLDLRGMEEEMVLMEHGFLCKYSPAGAQYYAFIELPAGMMGENIITLQGGIFHFIQDKKSRIENALHIFDEQINKTDSFIIVETEELLTGKTKINESVYELRLVSPPLINSDSPAQNPVAIYPHL
jgi:DNA-binding transcriptional MerR regulator